MQYVEVNIFCLKGFGFDEYLKTNASYGFWGSSVWTSNWSTIKSCIVQTMHPLCTYGITVTNEAAIVYFTGSLGKNNIFH